MIKVLVINGMIVQTCEIRDKPEFWKMTQIKSMALIYLRNFIMLLAHAE